MCWKENGRTGNNCGVKEGEEDSLRIKCQWQPGWGLERGSGFSSICRSKIRHKAFPLKTICYFLLDNKQRGVGLFLALKISTSWKISDKIHMII